MPEDDSALRYAFIVNSSPDLMFMVSLDGTIDAVNDAFCAAVRYQRFAVLGKTLQHIDVSFGDAVVRDCINECAAGNNVVREIWLSMADRGRACFDCSFRPYSENGSQVSHIAVVARDVTPRFHAEREQRKATDRVRVLHRIATSANAALGLHQQLQSCLRALVELGPWVAASIVPVASNTITEDWAVQDDAPDTFYAAVRRLRKLRKGSIVGVCEATNSLDTRSDPAAKELEDHGLEHVFVCPLSPDDRIHGYLELYANVAPDSRWADVVEGTGVEMTHLISEAVTRAALLQSATEYQDLFDSAHDAILIFDNDRVIHVCNRRARELYGYTESELVGQHINLLSAEAYTYPESIAVHKTSFQTTQRTKDGTEIVADIHTSPVTYLGADMVMSINRDVTERVLTEEKLRHSALHDGLTGLPNRAHLTQEVRKISEQRGHATLLFVELDRFKTVNDAWGLTIGDRVLNEIGQRLLSIVSSDEMVARIGGDEFAVLLRSSDQTRARVLAERIRSSFLLAVYIEHREIFVSACIGVASANFDGARPSKIPQLSKTEDFVFEAAVVDTSEEQPLNRVQPEHILRDANIALVRAKSLGNASVEFFDQQMRDDAISRLDIEQALERAIERSELSVQYQPIHHIGTRRLMGFEALLRWERPGRGFVSPAKLVPIAEETGLIVGIGHWVLEATCRQVAEWRKSHSYLTVNVNVSPKQVWRADFASEVFAVLDASGLPPEALKLEITESMLLHDPQEVAKRLQEFRDAGVSICIDDFGTGFSSLSYLQSLPLDVLKIDRAFVRDAGVSGQHAIIRAIIALAGALDLDVVAEGIETETELAFLRALKCGAGQGYLFSRPLTPEQVHHQYLTV